MDETELKRLMDQAQLEKAQVEARKAAREEAEASSPAAVARRNLEAENAAVKSARENLLSYLPDLSKVNRGDLAVQGDGGPAAGTGAGGEAIKAAAVEVAKKIVERLGSDDWSVMVTTEAELAAADATYLDLKSGVERITGLADEAAAAARSALSRPSGLVEVAAVTAVATAAASLLPGIISLLSKPKTVTSGSIEFDDLTASIAVAGVLKGNNRKRHIFHNKFQLMPEGSEIGSDLATLRTEKRQELVELKRKLEGHTESADSAVVAEALTQVTAVVEGIDAFLQLAETVPEGETLSPKTVAIVHERIRNGSTRALLIKAQSASGMQMIANNLVAQDRFSVVTAATISWMLLETTGEVSAAGLATGTAHANGVIGRSFQFS